MICVIIAPESRTLGRADLLNASREADLIELCLDRFVSRPDIPELISGLEKPVIVSCRRQKDGGAFKGTEEERLQLLREALAAEPAFIELELDIASRLPQVAKTRRVVSVNRPFQALTDLPALQQQADDVGADVLKLVWPGLLIDSLEPVLSAMAAKPEMPIVGLPIGFGGSAFSLFAKRLGAPWVYASLEQGMETHDGLPSLNLLRDRYLLSGMNAQTRMVGIAGYGGVRDRTLAAFNAAFQELNLNCRCVPLEIGPVASLPELLDKFDVSAVVVAPSQGQQLLAMGTHPEPAVALGQHLDLLLRKKDGWHGYNVLWRSVLKVVERTLRRQRRDALSLEKTSNVILGNGRIAQTLRFGLRQLKGTSILALPEIRTAVDFCPHCGEALDDPTGDSLETIVPGDLQAEPPVPYSELPAKRPDVLFLTEPTVELGFGPNCLNPLLLQPPLVVVDACNLLWEGELLTEARARGCHVVRPLYILGEHLAVQFKALTGHDLPDAAFQQAISLGN